MLNIYSCGSKENVIIYNKHIIDNPVKVCSKSRLSSELCCCVISKIRANIIVAYDAKNRDNI